MQGFEQPFSADIRILCLCNFFIWEFPLFWGPYNKDPTIQGTRLGSPILGNSHIRVDSTSQPPAGFRQKSRRALQLSVRPRGCNIGALIVRIGFWGPLYYSYNKELTK